MAVEVATTTKLDVTKQIKAPGIPTKEERLGQLTHDISALVDNGLTEEFPEAFKFLSLERSMLTHGTLGVRGTWEYVESLRAEAQGRKPRPFPWEVSGETSEPEQPGSAKELILPQE